MFLGRKFHTACTIFFVTKLICLLPTSPYYRAAEIGNYHYGQGHPMKPHRVRMTHNLVVNYGLYREMEVFRPKPVSRDQMTRFHSDDYINFLRVINPDNMSEFLRHLQRCEAIIYQRSR